MILIQSFSLLNFIFSSCSSSEHTEDAEFSVVYKKGDFIVPLNKAGITVEQEDEYTTIIKGDADDGYYSMNSQLFVKMEKNDSNKNVDIAYTKSLELEEADTSLQPTPLVFKVVNLGVKKFMIKLTTNCFVKVEEEKKGKCLHLNIISPFIEKNCCVNGKIGTQKVKLCLKHGFDDFYEKIKNIIICKFKKCFEDKIYCCSKKWIEGIKDTREYIRCRKLREGWMECCGPYECKPSKYCSDSSPSSCLEICSNKPEEICVQEKPKKLGCDIVCGIVNIMKGSVICDYVSGSYYGNYVSECLKKICNESSCDVPRNICDFVIDVVLYHCTDRLSPESGYVKCLKPELLCVSPLISSKYQNICHNSEYKEIMEPVMKFESTVQIEEIKPIDQIQEECVVEGEIVEKVEESSLSSSSSSEQKKKSKLKKTKKEKKNKSNGTMKFCLAAGGVSVLAVIVVVVVKSLIG